MSITIEKTSPLEITEILEQVISYLSIGDIARAQGTSKYWRTVIKNSKVIKRTCFLAPVKAFETFEWVEDDSAPYIFSYKLAKSPAFKPLSELSDTIRLADQGVKKLYPVFSFHPVLLRAMAAKKNPMKTVIEICVNIRSLHRRKPGPWLDTLITQPPLQKLGSRSLSVLGTESICPPADCKAGGITFRHLLENTIQRKKKSRQMSGAMSYEELWGEWQELYATTRSRQRREVLSEHWTWREKWIDFQVLGAVAEHSPWVKVARGIAMDECNPGSLENEDFSEDESDDKLALPMRLKTRLCKRLARGNEFVARFIGT